jgi:O-antigen/teichoic acid export membrane protein
MSTFIKNSVSNIITVVINLVSPLILIPVLTKDLGLGVYGEYVSLVALAALFNVIFEFGLGMAISQLIASEKDRGIVSCYISSYTTIKLLSAAVLITSFSLYFFIKGVDSRYLALLGLILVGVMDYFPVLSGLEKYIEMTKVTLISKFFLVILIIIFSISEINIVIALWCLIISRLVQLFLSILVVINTDFKITCSLDFKVIKHMLKISFGYYISRLFVNIYQQSSTYMVSVFYVSELVAIYSISLQLYKVGQSAIGAVSRVLFTSMNSRFSLELLKKVTFFTMVVYVLGVLVALSYGRDILSAIFSFNVQELYSSALILYFSLFFVIVSSYFGYPLLSPIKKERYAHLGILLSSIFYFVIFVFVLKLEVNPVYALPGCIFISDVAGFILRLYYANKFKEELSIR